MAGDRRRQRDYDGDYYVDGGLLFSVSSLAASNIVPAAASHSWAKHKKLTGNEIQKNREINLLYFCLQQFYKILISRPDRAMTGNGSYVNLPKLARKNSGNR